MTMSQLRSRTALRMHIPGYSLAHRLLCEVRLYELHRQSPGCCCVGATVVRHHGCYMRVCYGYIMAVLWRLLRLLCHPGERKRVCSFYSCLHLLPASWLESHLPWDQWTVRAPTQLTSWTGAATQRASLMAQWWRISLPMQEAGIQSLILEGPLSHRATKPIYHNCWAYALKPGSCKYWAHVPERPRFSTREATAMRNMYTTMKSSPRCN